MHARAIRYTALGLMLLLAAAAGGCRMKPTPYQPRSKQGGYEETRLKDRVFRVSFQGNRSTLETTVLDYLYLRCAELTEESGFTHFVIVQDYGKTEVAGRPRSSFSLGLGFGRGVRGGHLGAGAHLPVHSGYDRAVDYRLGVFVIRMLTAEEAKKEPEALEVAFLLKSLHGKYPKTNQGVY